MILLKRRQMSGAKVCSKGDKKPTEPIQKQLG